MLVIIAERCALFRHKTGAPWWRRFCVASLLQLNWCGALNSDVPTVPYTKLQANSMDNWSPRSIQTASSFLRRRERPEPGIVNALQTLWKMARTLTFRWVGHGCTVAHTHTQKLLCSTNVIFTFIVFINYWGTIRPPLQHEHTHI